MDDFDSAGKDDEHAFWELANTEDDFVHVEFDLFEGVGETDEGYEVDRAENWEY